MMGEMGHDEVRELLQDAAVEPGGLERLMAGDTPTAAAVAGHLAGCPECTDELDRLRRSVGLIRPAIQAVPPPELRERTLQYVAEMGRPRGGDTAAAATARGDGRAAGGPLTIAPRPGRVLDLRSFAALAAMLILAVAATGLVVGGGRDAVIRDQAAELEAVGDVARWTLRVDAKDDARRVALASTTGVTTSGTLVFSPSSTELVVVADDLARPAPGFEYRCWVELNGTRETIGRMFFGGNLAYWVGPVPEVAGLAGGAHFGVSLVSTTGPNEPGQPVLEGNG